MRIGEQGTVSDASCDITVVETMGFEPTTPCLQTVRLRCPEAADLVSPRHPTASK